MAVGATETRVTPVLLTEAGALLSGGSVAADLQGNAFKNNERTFVVINNVTAGGDCVVTLVAQKTTVKVPGYGDAVACSNITLTVADGATGIFQLPTTRFNDGDQDAHIGFSEITGVTIGVYELMRGV